MTSSAASNPQPQPLLSAPLVTAAALLFASALYWLAQRACVETDTLSPDHAAMHYYLGDYQMTTGQAEDAAKNFRRAIANNPRSFAPHNGLGNALVRLGKLDEAAACYETALAIEPDNAEANCNLGNILLSRGQTAEACAHYRRALETEPNEVSTLNNLAWIMATSPDDALRDGAQAVEHAERVSQILESSHPTILMTLAAAYAEAGRFDEAAQTAGRSIQLAEAASNHALANDVRIHLQAYRSGKPIRIPHQK